MEETYLQVGKYDVKERDESKSQHLSVTEKISCELANMMSKNEMKANHNTLATLSELCTVGKYDVKERDESKSQLEEINKLKSDRWQI